MTRLSLLDQEKARAVLQEALGEEPTLAQGIADLIRDELTARRSCARAATIRRVIQFVSPAAALDASTVSDVCDLLEREGDIVLGAGGVLFSTPIRAVDLGNGSLRVTSSLSTRCLAALVAGVWSVSALSRTCKVESVDNARASIEAAGGVVLTPSDWACLDRIPAADQRWLDLLDRRLHGRPEAAGSLERDEPLTWAGCVATPSGFRWKADDPDLATKLWRARNRWGQWHYAWTDLGPPRTARFLSLDGDEGSRTAFAVAHALGVPLSVSVNRQEPEAVLSVTHWLPVAEYRFVSVSSTRAENLRGGSRWSMPSNRLTNVLGVLRERLGLIAHEEANP